MSSSGYQAWSVTAGEIPTTSKWNTLGSNDASFNTGNGFNDAIIQPRHFGRAVIPGSALGIQSVLFTYLNSSPSIGTGVWVPVGYNTTWINSGAIPYVVNGTQITVPYTGLYRVIAQNSFNNVSDGGTFLVSYSINSTSGPTLPWTRSQAGTTAVNSILGDIILPMNSGDKLTIYAYAVGSSLTLQGQTPGTGNVPPTGDLTYLNLAFLGTQV